MRAVCDDTAYLQFMLDFESALAHAEAATGVIPASAVKPIEDACRADRFDIAALALAAHDAGNLAIPLVKALTANVAAADADAARYVHWGSTSQDVLDTAFVLQLRAAIDLLLADLDRAVAAFAKLADQHRNTAMAGRTLLQHAMPIPFGLKLAEYAAALHRSRLRLRRTRIDISVLQFGGAAGTLASLGDMGLVIAEQVGKILDLQVADAPWHSHRDRFAEVASVFAILTGTCGKIARDVSLMMQTDVAEVFEPAGEGRGGSSTLPHKRNPVASAAALAAATMTPNLAATIFAAQVQDHERGTGPWHAEWPTLPTLQLVTSGALAAIVDIAEGLEVDAVRMRANIDTTHGLIMAEAISMALADKVGKSEAHHIIQAASRIAIAEKKHLRDVLAGDPRVTAHLDAARLVQLFDPMAYQGVSQSLIDRLLASLSRS